MPISSASDYAAAMAAAQAYELGVIQPIIPALEALQTALQTAQVSLGSGSTSRGRTALTNIQSMVTGYLVECQQVVAALTPPAPVAAPPMAAAPASS